MAQACKRKLVLERLVDELIKDQPNCQLVKELTAELGIPYSLDPMIQINTVLQSMNTVLLQPNRRKDIER